jgi:excisionase family DNA binding protein
MSTPLTASQAAARLGVSERTIQRRCKSGKIKAELVTDADGEEWRIDPATLPTGDAISADTDDKVTTAPGEPAHSQKEPVTTQAPATGADTADRVTPTVTTRDDARLLDQLQTENSFLRAMVEQHQRSEAELRAALREALKAMPKAITAGDASAPIEAAQGDESTHVKETTPAAKQSPQRGTQARVLKPWQRVLARVLGLR